jgi:hypothetical protein
MGWAAFWATFHKNIWSPCCLTTFIHMYKTETWGTDVETFLIQILTWWKHRRSLAASYLVGLCSLWVARWYICQPKSHFGIFLKALEWNILVGMFYGICYVLFVIWYILRSFGHFYQFWYLIRRKLWQPCTRLLLENKSSSTKILKF